MILLRKLRTLSLIVRECSNWVAITKGRLGLQNVSEIRLRNGLVFSLLLPSSENGSAPGGKKRVRHWGDVFEPAIADCYRIRKVQPDLIVDVGMNIGAFSSLAAKTHPQAEIYAFEPNPAAVELAKINFKRNGLDKVHVIESPLTLDGREVTLNINQNRGASNVFLSGEGEKIVMKSVTLAEVPLRKANEVFFKFDCEGVEGELIEWLVNNNDQLPQRVTIICEYHDWCPQPIGDLVEKLKGVGFDAKETTHFDEAYLEASRR